MAEQDNPYESPAAEDRGPQQSIVPWNWAVSGSAWGFFWSLLLSVPVGYALGVQRIGLEAEGSGARYPEAFTLAATISAIWSLSAGIAAYAGAHRRLRRLG